MYSSRIDIAHGLPLLRLCLLALFLFCVTGCEKSEDDINSNNDDLPGDDVPAEVVTGLTAVAPKQWTETSVRKVLHTFAYAGLATEDQIVQWSEMDPAAAISEMLTFNYTNQKLSPAQDQTVQYANALASLQDFWSGSLTGTDVPMQWHRRSHYHTLNSRRQLPSIPNLRNTWIQAVNTRGINPFVHRIAFYLSNYQLAVFIQSGGVGMTRSYYDEILENLAAGSSFTDLISDAAKSAAVAKRYDHRSNTYNNDTHRFSGNDDFAREFFQLFFRLQGETEDIDYHEGVTIENNARVLTGMNIDKVVYAYGSPVSDHWWVAPLDFTDHSDDTGRIINNFTNHYSACLELLRAQICGTNAGEKIDMLADITAQHPEVMANLPVYIVGTLADDNLTDAKITAIREEWAESNDDLLVFLRTYAISTAFHDAATFKYKTTFDRNLTLHNTVVLDNNEALMARKISDSPRDHMTEQGGHVFSPSHDVFGSQTGDEAAERADIFRSAYKAAVTEMNNGISKYSSTYYIYEPLATEIEWDKDWSSAIPADSNGTYRVSDVAEWLWTRMLADGTRNFDSIARAQVYALLAYGTDFGYTVTQLDATISTDPEATYSSSQIDTDPGLVAIMNTLATTELDLASSDALLRRQVNHHIALAVNFISVMPYSFAMEGL